MPDLSFGEAEGLIANNANRGNKIMRIENKDLVLPELSYKIIGAAFSVFNELGWGFSEKHYQKALAKEFDSLHISYKREVFIPFKYKTTSSLKYFADFIVDDRVLLELKVVKRLGYSQVRQTLDYLKTAKMKLGILIYFTLNGVKYRRVLNSQI